jgi:hypothetical protein
MRKRGGTISCARILICDESTSVGRRTKKTTSRDEVSRPFNPVLSGPTLGSESRAIASQETGSINFPKVTVACLLKVMRPLRIKCTVVLRVPFTSFYAVAITLIERVLRVAENVMTVAAVIIKIRIVVPPAVPPPGTEITAMDWSRNNNYAPLLRLSRGSR